MFCDCRQLSTVVIKSNIHIINSYAFLGCEKLTTIKYFGDTNPICSDNHLVNLISLSPVLVLPYYPYNNFANCPIGRIPTPSQRLHNCHQFLKASNFLVSY